MLLQLKQYNFCLQLIPNGFWRLDHSFMLGPNKWEISNSKSVDPRGREQCQTLQILTAGITKQGKWCCAMARGSLPWSPPKATLKTLPMPITFPRWRPLCSWDPAPSVKGSHCYSPFKHSLYGWVGLMLTQEYRNPEPRHSSHATARSCSLSWPWILLKWHSILPCFQYFC